MSAPPDPVRLPAHPAGHRRRPPFLWAGVGGLALVVAVSSIVLAASSGASPSAPPPTALPTATPAQTLPLLTGIGAADAQWDLQHRTDPAKAYGCCYDPQSGGQDLYDGVIHTNWHVSTFILYPVPAWTEEAALARLQTLYPPDTRLLWDRSQLTCRQIEIQSQQLASAVGGVDNGTRLIELTTFDPEIGQDTEYDTQRVTEVQVQLYPPVPVKRAPDC